MALPRRIALATKNEHKLVEIIRICSDWPVEWVTVHDRDLEEGRARGAPGSRVHTRPTNATSPS